MSDKCKWANPQAVSVLLAVWLADDPYDHDVRSNAISVTSLMRPLRQLALMMYTPNLQPALDQDLTRELASSRGTAVHDAIEAVWKDPHRRNKALASLGVPKNVRQRIVVNPTDSETKAWAGAGMLPMYLEIRNEKKVGNWIVTGKFDCVFEGRLRDIKNTSTYVFEKAAKDEDYAKQGSLYKWLNPEIIVDDAIDIDFIFNDWSPHKVYGANYPPTNPHTKAYSMDDTATTGRWVKERLTSLEGLGRKAGQDAYPLCTQKELWQDDTVYAYYKGGTKISRSTKNYTKQSDALKRKADDGAKGLIVKRPGKAKACGYCPAADICDQRKSLEAQGLLA